MRQRKCKRFPIISTSSIGKLQIIMRKSRVLLPQKFVRFLLPAGIMGFLAVAVVVPLSYAPDTSVPFPYIPPPTEGGYYVELTPWALDQAYYADYSSPESAQTIFAGKSVIFKNIKITESLLSHDTHDTYITISRLLFAASVPSDLKHLKEGDFVDIVGVVQGPLEGYSPYIGLSDCLFLPAGLVPLPLPGAPALVGGY